MADFKREQQITIRIQDAAERKALAEVARFMGLSRSAVVRLAVHKLLAERDRSRPKEVKGER